MARRTELAPLAVYREGFSHDPALDTALSHAMLRAVDRGERGECLRVYRPGDALAFSMLDRTRPGFDEATRLARAAGFAPILRLAGGRAAVFERAAVAFAWTVAAREPRRGIRQRFEVMSAAVVEALRALGVDARVGEVPGEYCPGEFSVNARGQRKLMGVGQRVLRRAAHVGGVILVRRSAPVARLLEEVYAALDFPVEAQATGAVEDEVADITTQRVADALVAAVAERRPVEERGFPALPESVFAEAHERREQHDAERASAETETPLRAHGKILDSEA